MQLALSLTEHLERGIDGVFKTVRVVGRSLVFIGEVHAIVARAHSAQGETEMARDRLGFLERQALRNLLRAACTRRFAWRNPLLVAVPPVWDLWLCAKHLFVDAKLVWL